MIKARLSFYLIRILTFPFSLLSYRKLHSIGNFVGLLAFYLIPKYRKRSLSNLALAKDLHLTEKQIIKTTKKSFQNLAINILEYPKFAKETDFSKIITCTNPEKALEIYNKGTGIIFFCGHQANWETLFLDGNLRMKGVAIGKPTKNKYLYQWIISIREKTGGRVITPKNALREGLKSLKKGIFLGIVGDQGMPDSNYSYPFFGRKAWNSTAPALLAYKTNSPIMVATVKRKNDIYYIDYSEPIWPDLEKPLDQEITRLMDKSLFILQESIKENLDQWLWQHNRWKQQSPKDIRKRFRHDSLSIILPEKEDEFKRIYNHLKTLKHIYQNAFLILHIPEKYAENFDIIQADEINTYKNIKDVLTKDYRPKIIFNFHGHKKIKKHFKKLSAFEVLTEKNIRKIAKKNYPDKIFKDLSDVLLASSSRITQ